MLKSQQQQIADDFYGNVKTHCKKVFYKTGDVRYHNAMKEFEQGAPDVNLGRDNPML